MAVKKITAVLVIVIFFMPFLYANDTSVTGNKNAVVKMIAAVEDYITKCGLDSTLKEVDNPQGIFYHKSMYVFVYDTLATVIAHPINHKLIGKNLFDIPDVNGTFFRRDIMAVAREKNSGWVEYKYKNPDNGRIENKTTYLKKIGNLIFCCGFYK